MLSLDRWREIWDTLVRNKLRTFLTMLAMSWGIFMLVFLLGLGKGLQNGVQSGFADDATNSIWIFGGQTSLAHEGMPIGRRVRFDNRDVDAVRKIDGVEKLTGRFSISGGPFGGELRVSHGDKVQSFDVRSVHPDHLYLEKTIIVLGRFLNDVDLAQKRKVAIIGIPVAEFLFDRHDVVGEWIEVNNVSFQVVGVFNDEGNEGEQRKVYLPISTAQAAFNGRDRVHQIMFTVGAATVEESKALADRVKASLADAHNFSADDPQAARVRNNVENFASFLKIFQMIDVFIWLMGICVIIAGCVGISNIMMIIVRERTKEIGIRKALGATPWNVVSTLLQESVVLTAAAGYGGMVAGVGLLALISNAIPDGAKEMFRDPQVNITVAVGATIVLMIAGALAGLFPALAAARVNPIVALRDE